VIASADLLVETRLAKYFEYLLDQRLTKRKLTLEDLFAPEILRGFGS
jgi:hypothetical protein